MKTVLVTGGAGFIGSNFVRCLLRAEPAAKIVNLDALTYAGSLENLKGLPDDGRHLFVRGDICAAELVARLFAEYDIDTVVHFAAESHVDRSILNSGDFVRTNVEGTRVLLEAAKNNGKIRFHHISTDEVYGELPLLSDEKFKETTPYAPQPDNLYALSKAEADKVVLDFSSKTDMYITISVSR